MAINLAECPNISVAAIETLTNSETRIKFITLDRRFQNDCTALRLAHKGVQIRFCD